MCAMAAFLQDFKLPLPSTSFAPYRLFLIRSIWGLEILLCEKCMKFYFPHNLGTYLIPTTENLGKSREKHCVFANENMCDTEYVSGA